MADWVVSDAGDDTYNGDYDEAGEHEGKPYYTHGDPVRYLAWNGSASIWVLWDNLPIFIQRGDYSGTGADLPANPWEAEGGAGPAPTVAAAGGGAVYEHDLSGVIEVDGEIVVVWEPAGPAVYEHALGGSLDMDGEFSVVWEPASPPALPPLPPAPPASSRRELAPSPVLADASILVCPCCSRPNRMQRDGDQYRCGYCNQRASLSVGTATVKEIAVGGSVARSSQHGTWRMTRIGG